MPPTLEWDGSALVAVDQTLPGQVRVVRLTTVDQVVDAVRRLVIRGAPAIGVAGAFGVVIAARDHPAPSGGRRRRSSRPGRPR
jgi:methylthioribose-1-phosphate isomerase